MRLRFTKQATENLREIGDYLKERNPAAALRVRAAIYTGLENLILFPFVGRRQTIENVRKFVIQKYPYLVYYAVDEAAGEIVILSVKHAARERDYEDA
jgi:plasmid stabilization system protein ParE